MPRPLPPIAEGLSCGGQSRVTRPSRHANQDVTIRPAAVRKKQQRMKHSSDPVDSVSSKCFVLLGLTLLLLAAGSASSRAEDSLDRNFTNPPRSAQPSVYWWWLFNRVDKEGITRDLEEFRAKGIREVNMICTGGYAGSKPLFGVEAFGKEWRELFRHAVKEADRLKINMGFNLAAGGWVMIGPWVTPEHAMKKLVQAETGVSGPKKFSGKLPQPPIVDGYYRDLWVQAFRDAKQNPQPSHRPKGENSAPIDPSNIIDLSDHMKPDGSLDWDVPEGGWVILRTGYTLTGSRWNAYPGGDTFTGGDGYQIDYLSAAALDDHFNHLGTLVLDEARKAGGHLGFLWSDSWECGKLTWTQDLRGQFQKYRGYDLKPFLPALAGRTVANADVTARFKADFDRTIQDCIADNFYGRFADLCHKNGLKMGSEAGGPNDIPPQDTLKNLGRCDVPAGEFWVTYQYHNSPAMRCNLKQTSSAAHIYGKTLAQAEAFTQQEGQRTHWSLGPGDLKPYADVAFCEGINAFMLHQATCQPPKDGKPGYEFCAGQHWNPNCTWWEQSPAFFSFLTRCQYMLRQGHFVGDVCFYLGEQPPTLVPPKHVDPSLGPGYDCDYCNAEVLLTRMSVKDGRVVLPDGMSYRLLVLQNCVSPLPEICQLVGGYQQLAVSPIPSNAMSVDVVKKIRELVREGATVIGPKPEKAAGLKDYPQCDDEVRKIADVVWSDCDGTTRKEHRFGRGRVIWGKSPREVLATEGIPPDFQVEGESRPSTASLDYIHRTLDDAEIYYVINRNPRSESQNCKFRVQGKQPEIWDPIRGEIREASCFQQIDGLTTVPLEFAPYGSCFVVFRKPIGPDSAGTSDRNFPKLAAVQTLVGPWAVAFDPAWGGPATIQFPELIDWTKRPEDGIKFYSGKATYRKTFDLNPGSLQTTKPNNGKPERLFLDLGNVKHVAEIRLNGKNLGILWTNPWRVDITDVAKPSRNKLEIDVVNLWANRVIGDLNLPKEKRFAKTHDAFRFDMLTKDTPLIESGLLGPVRVLREQP